MTQTDFTPENAKRMLKDTREELTLLDGGTEKGIKRWEARYQTTYPGSSYLRVMQVQEAALIRNYKLK